MIMLSLSSAVIVWKKLSWFNPENKELEGVIPHKNPDLTGKGLGASYGYVQGDRRFEVFRGTMFTQVDTVQEIAAALKKVAGV